MKFIISGAGGFLGRVLLNLLTQRSDACSVIALSRQNLNLNLNNAGHNNIHIFTNDDFLNSEQSLQGYCLINLAYARNNNFDQIKDSCEWTFSLLNKANELGLTKIVNISSQSVYDPYRKKPAREEDLPKLSEPYDMGKYYLENWIKEFSEKAGLDFLNLRLASLVGPGFTQRIISRLIIQAFSAKEMPIFMNGQVFSYTHVIDAANAILTATQNSQSTFWNRVYNVGSDEYYSIEDIADSINRAFRKDNINLKIAKTIEKMNPLNNSIDSSLFRGLTGWHVKYKLDDIVEEEYELQKRNRLVGNV